MKSDPDIIVTNKLFLGCLEHTSALGCKICPTSRRTEPLQELLIPLGSTCLCRFRRVDLSIQRLVVRTSFSNFASCLVALERGAGPCLISARSRRRALVRSCVSCCPLSRKVTLTNG